MGHEIPRIYRGKDERYRLEGKKCVKGHLIFPKRPICPTCEQDKKKTEASTVTVYQALEVVEN